MKAQVGAQIGRRRNELKLSMRAAAKLGGVSPTAWSDLEAGKSPPSLSTQRAVSVALGWPADWLDRILAGETPSQPVDGRPGELQALIALVEELSGRLAQLQAQVAELAVLAAPPPKRQAPPRAAQSKEGSP